MSALRLTKRQVIFRELFQLVGTDRDVSDELFCVFESPVSCTAQIRERNNIFLLGRHLGFGNCGGLERGNISRRSRRRIFLISQLTAAIATW